MTDKTKRKKHISIFLSLISTIMIFLLVMIFLEDPVTKYNFVKVDKNSLEFFVEDNFLDETFDKIQNKKYDKFDFADKMTVKSVVKKYSKDKYKRLSSNGKELKLKNFLKDNEKIHYKISSDKDEQLTALIVFHKVVIDKDESYAQYLDQKIDEEKLLSFSKEKEKEDNYMFMMLVYYLAYINITFMVYWFICDVIFDLMVFKYGSYSE